MASWQSSIILCQTSIATSHVILSCHLHAPRAICYIRTSLLRDEVMLAVGYGLGSQKRVLVCSSKRACVASLVATRCIDMALDSSCCMLVCSRNEISVAVHRHHPLHHVRLQMPFWHSFRVQWASEVDRVVSPSDITLAKPFHSNGGYDSYRVCKAGPNSQIRRRWTLSHLYPVHLQLCMPMA